MAKKLKIDIKRKPNELACGIGGISALLCISNIHTIATGIIAIVFLFAGLLQVNWIEAGEPHAQQNKR